MLFKTQSAALFGIDAYVVQVEVDLAQGGLGSFTTVGLPDAAVKESRERIKAAIKNCGFNFPTYQNITVNLAPADRKKEGSGFGYHTRILFSHCVDTHHLLRGPARVNGQG